MSSRNLLIVGLLLSSVVTGCSEGQVTTTGPQNPDPLPTDTVTLGSIVAVVGVDSIPWEGAIVDIGTASGTTASDGTVTFSDVTEGLYQVTVQGVPAGVVCENQVVTVRIETTAVAEFDCITTASVTGLVTIQGQPFAQAEVYLYAYAGEGLPGGSSDAFTRTGPDGRYEFEVRAKEYQVLTQQYGQEHICSSGTGIIVNPPRGGTASADFNCVPLTGLYSGSYTLQQNTCEDMALPVRESFTGTSGPPAGGAGPAITLTADFPGGPNGSELIGSLRVWGPDALIPGSYSGSNEGIATISNDLGMTEAWDTGVDLEDDPSGTPFLTFEGTSTVAFIDMVAFTELCTQEYAIEFTGPETP